MKTRIHHIIPITAFLVLIFFSSCEDREKLDALTAENGELQQQYNKQLMDTRLETRRADSLVTVINSLETELQKTKGELPAYKATSNEQRDVERLVLDLHRSWTAMFKNKNTDDLMKHFLPRFTASTIRINTENIPSVKRTNDTNFEDHLNALLEGTDISISFGETKFLYTEVKNSKFFVTSYRTRLRVYENNKQVHTTSLVTQLAGEKKDDWKIGSYNWVVFNYD